MPKESIQKIIDQCMEAGLFGFVWDPDEDEGGTFHFANPYPDTLVANGRYREVSMLPDGVLRMPHSGENVEQMIDVCVGIGIVGDDGA